MDKISSTKRSENMRRIKGRNTQPELVVRNTLRSWGIGYRLHRLDLPGKPDIVMSGRRLTIFVHGCFWHQHEGCRRSFTPANRSQFWQEKFSANKRRDETVQAKLRDMGWRVEVIWECETKNEKYLQRRMAETLKCSRQETGCPHEK